MMASPAMGAPMAGALEGAPVPPPMIASWVGLALALGAPPAPAPVVPGVARLTVAEVDACRAACPALPAEATSDWLRSPEGQRANGCHLRCRTAQPATALFRELAAPAVRGDLTPDAPLARLAAKDRPALVARLQAAVKDLAGRRLGGLCARTRELIGRRDEAAFLECLGAPPATIDPSQALRCAATYAERDLDWMKRCPVLEARTDVAGCASRADEAAARHGGRPDARARCEEEAVEWLASSFRIRP